MDLSRWFNLRKQAESSVRPVARASQIERSTIPVTMEDEEGEFEAVVPVPDAIGSGVRAGAVAEEALEHADQASSDALAAAQEAYDALVKANAAVAGTVVEFAVSGDPGTVPTSGWSTVAPPWVDGSWVWSRTTTVFGDASTVTSDPVLLTGPAGEPGSDGTPGSPGVDGKGITSTEVRYQASTSGTVEPTGVWLEAIPVVPEGQFLWTRTVITYSDASASTAFSVALMGESGAPGADGSDGADGAPGSDGAPGADGAPGDDGISVSELTRYYYLGTSEPSVPTVSPPPVPWMSTEPAYTPGSSASLFEVTRTVMSDGAWSYGPVSLSASFAAAKQAYDLANDTKFLAEGLYQVIPSTTAPATSPTGALKQGDQWWKIGTGATDGKFVGVAVWDGSAWQDRQIVADSVLVPGSVGPVLIEDGAITSPKIAGDAIDGMTVTGATVRTAPLGQRFELDIDGLRAYRSDGQVVAVLRPSNGGLRIVDSAFEVETQDMMQLSWQNPGGFGVQHFAPGGSQVLSSSWMLLDPESGEFRFIGVGSGTNFSFRGRTIFPGNTFATKAALDLWSAPDGTVAWVTAEQRQYVRANGVWMPWYDGANDTDWADCTLINGTSMQGGMLPKARIHDGNVQLQWGVSGSGIGANASRNVCQMPNGIATSEFRYATAPGNSPAATCMVVVKPNGQIEVRTGATAPSYIIFDQVNVPI